VKLYWWRFNVEVRDMWVGLFWDLKEDGEHTDIHLYVCLVPMCVFEFCLRRL